MSKALVPFKPVPPEAALSRAIAVTGLWQLGRGSRVEDIRAQTVLATLAIANGEVAALSGIISARPTREQFAVILDELIGSFAPRQGQDMRIFSKMLAKDVAEVGASRVALEAAAKALRASNTFLPSIEEVLEAVKWQKQVCDARVHLLERLPARVAAAERAINPPAGSE